MSDITAILKKINDIPKKDSIDSYLKFYRENELAVAIFHKKKDKEYNIGNKKISHQELMNIFVKKIEDSELDPNQKQIGSNLTRSFFMKNEITSESVANYQKLLSNIDETLNESINKDDRPIIKIPIKNIHSKKMIPRNLWDKKQ
jgi:hypothetical protein